LLPASFSTPRVQHLMRCSPSVDHPALSEFDRILRSAICKITNCDLSEIQWLQASLPIRDGGRGIQRVSSLALPTCLASAVGCLSLQDAILSQADVKPDSYFVLYLPRWMSSWWSTTRLTTVRKTIFLGSARCPFDKATAESNLSTEHGTASFLTASALHSGDWLLFLPITVCGLRLEDDAVSTAIASRQGVNLREEGTVAPRLTLSVSTV